MKNLLIVIFLFIFFFFLFGVMTTPETKKEEKQTQKAFEVYMNEPLNVTDIDFIVTDIKEQKKIGKYKAKNIFLQVFVTVKNTKSARNYLPFTLALIHRQDDKWICLLDERFKNTLEKTEYLAGGYVLDLNQEIKASMIFDCEAYLNNKAGSRKSKPSDFKLFIYSKEKKDGGYIFLEENPNENNNR